MAYLDESGVTSLTADIKALADADYAPYAQGIEYIRGTQTAATNAWTGVTVDSTLRTGKVIAYYLPYAGNSSAATLNLTLAGGTTTGAKALRRTASSTVTTHFAAGNVLILIYDGTYWKVSAYYASDSNTVPTGYCTTAAATAAKAATCTYGYRDDATYFPCLFRYANTASNATLAISSYATTALPIYVNGARTSSSNTFGAGVIMFLYYNSAYYCYNDGRFPIVVDGAVTSVQEAVAANAYTLPAATTSTLGGVMVDGSTITADANGVISAAGGGSGGGGYDLVINVTLSNDGRTVVSHDADFLECMALARAFASGQGVRAVAYCRKASYDDEDDTYAAGAYALPLLSVDTQSYGGGQYETDGGWYLTFLAVASITQRTVSGSKVSYVSARQLTVSASNDDPELGVSVNYSVIS